MIGKATYLDHNATAPVRREAADAVCEVLTLCGNPSSVHGAGRRAHGWLETARERVAALVGRPPAHVIFTSGGTEANALALKGCGRSRVFVSAIEHPSVLNALDHAELIPVDGDGIVDLNWLDKTLEECGSEALVSVMAANNETGVLQPMEKVAEVVRRHGALLHSDAVQLVGKAPLDKLSAQTHMMSLSAHKLGGPQGVGAVIADELDVALAPLIKGGGQERSKRAGTENLPGIVGFGVAAELAKNDLEGAERLAVLRDDLENRLTQIVPAAVFAAQDRPRLPNTSCFAVPGLKAETLVMALDLAGVMVSAGSACSSGKVKASHVLKSQGWSDDLAAGAIRVSLGRTTTEVDIEKFMDAWMEVYRRLAPENKPEGAAA